VAASLAARAASHVLWLALRAFLLAPATTEPAFTPTASTASAAFLLLRVAVSPAWMTVPLALPTALPARFARATDLLAELSSTEVACAVLRMQLNSSTINGRYLKAMNVVIELWSCVHACLAMMPAVQLPRQQDSALLSASAWAAPLGAGRVLRT
jgi:hypothetical protein